MRVQVRSGLPAKLSAPRLGSACPRPRLFALLDESRPLAMTCVWAPPGMGKTTLVAGYVHACELPSAWVRLDAADQDPAVFFANLQWVAREQFGVCIPALEPVHLADLRGFAQQAFRSFCEAGVAAAVLVLDDYHELPTNSPIHEALAAGLRELPVGWRVLVASRSALPPAFARHCVNGEIAQLGPGELRLTLDEAQALSATLGRPDTQEIAQLHAFTEGWTAGFVLLARSRRKGPLGAVGTGTADHAEQFVPYFLTQVLDGLPHVQRQTLLCTSLVPEVTPGLACALSGSTSGVEVLEEFAQLQLFVTRAEGASAVYRYHSLFRDCLQRALTRTLGAADLRTLRLRSAQELERTQYIGEAVDLYLIEGAVADAVRLVMQHAASLMASGRWQTLRAWIDKLPTEVRDASPWLRYWQAATIAALQPPTAIGMFEAAYAQFASRGETFGEILCACGIVHAYFLASSSFEGIAPWSDRLEALLNAVPGFPDVDTELRVCAGALTAESHCRIGSAFARAMAARVRELLDREPTTGVAAIALTSLTMYMLWVSDFRGLRELRPRLDAVRVLPDASPADRVWLGLMSFVALSYAEGNPRGALTAMDEAARQARDAGATVLAGTCELFRLTHLVSHGSVEDFEQAIRALTPAVDHLRPLDEARFWFSRAVGSLRQQRPQLALEEAYRSLRLVEKAKVPNLSFFLRVLLARVLVDLRRFEEALVTVDQAHQPLRAAQLQLPEMDTHMVRAYAALMQGNEDAAAAHLVEALAIGRATGAMNFLLYVPHQVEPLLHLAVAREIESEYVKELIRLLDIPAPAPYTAAWPWKVRVFTLGDFRVLVDGKVVEEGRKAQHRPRALLQALVAAGARDVSGAVLAHQLWPDADGAAAVRSFNSTLHRLRSLLGAEHVLRMAEGKLSLDQRFCWVDAWALDQQLDALLGDARASRDEMPPREVLALYGGAFLAHEPTEPWMLPTRHRLQSKLTRFVGVAARRLSEQGRCLDAAHLYRAALERDPLSEPLYRGLMNLYRALGERAEALRVYEACRDALTKSLGVMPGPETVALYQAILQDPPEGATRKAMAK